jgi:hypothetical protein
MAEKHWKEGFWYGFGACFYLYCLALALLF